MSWLLQQEVRPSSPPRSSSYQGSWRVSSSPQCCRRLQGTRGKETARETGMQAGGPTVTNNNSGDSPAERPQGQGCKSKEEGRWVRGALKGGSVGLSQKTILLGKKGDWFGYWNSLGTRTLAHPPFPVLRLGEPQRIGMWWQRRGAASEREDSHSAPESWRWWNTKALSWVSCGSSVWNTIWCGVKADIVPIFITYAILRNIIHCKYIW